MAARITGILLGLAILILAAFCVAKHLELRSIRAEIARLKEPTAATPATASVPVAAKRTALTSAARQRTFTNAVTGAGSRAKKMAIKKRGRREMAELMKDPKRKKFMEAVWTLHLDTAYGALFRHYEMTDDEMRYFQSLLLEKTFLAESFGVRRMEADAEGSAEDIRRQEQQAEAEVNGRIREFLGGEAYQEYESYETRLPDRMMLREFRDSLDVSGLPMSGEQEDELVGILHEERQNLPLLRQLTEKGGTGALLESLPPDRVKQEFEEGSYRVILRAKQALTPDQFESFTNYIGQLRDMMEIALTVQSAVESADDEKQK